MVRSIATSRSVSPRSLRELRIAARSTPAADVSDDAPRLRFRLDQRCRALGVALTEDWRTLARIFDETDAPQSTEEIWTRARALGLKASRSHVYQLINNLLALDVLIVAKAGRTLRYATPLAVRMILRTQDGQTPWRSKIRWRSKPWQLLCYAPAISSRAVTSRSNSSIASSHLLLPRADRRKVRGEPEPAIGGAEPP